MFCCFVFFFQKLVILHPAAARRDILSLSSCELVMSSERQSAMGTGRRGGVHLNSTCALFWKNHRFDTSLWSCEMNPKKCKIEFKKTPTFSGNTIVLRTIVLRCWSKCSSACISKLSKGVLREKLGNVPNWKTTRINYRDSVKWW